MNQSSSSPQRRTAYLIPPAKLTGSQTNQSSTASTNITSTTLSTLNGTSTTVIVPAGQNRLVNARWVGHAQASGGTCSMRIGAFNGASFTEFNPMGVGQVLVSRSGSGFENESQAVERSRILGSGTYAVVAQVARSSATTSCSVRNWHFAVQVIAT